MAAVQPAGIGAGLDLLVGITLGALVFGYLADRFGRKRLFIITLLLYATRS